MTANALASVRDDEEILVEDPRDGSLVGRLAAATPEEVREAIGRAVRALPAWRRTAAAQRGAALREIALALEAHHEDLVAWEQRETGRLEADARGGVDAAVGALREAAETAPVHRGKSLRGAIDALDLTRAEPRGVAAVVTPWNDPVAVSVGLIAAALATGNVVVHKPSERCPHLGERLGELLAAHLPDGVLQTVTGGAATGEALVSSTDVDVVAHVGSTRTGERIARMTALTGAHLVRENGGNDAMIVDSGVDPAWAASQAALGAFANSGQLCTSVERILVSREIADDFLAHLVSEAERRGRDVPFAPLVDERMRAHVHDQVRAARDAGARILTGGELPDGPGCHYPATVVTGCEPSSPLFREETFGPVAAVMVVEDFDAALRRAAEDEYGLAATVLTTDMDHALRAVDALPVGTLKINDVFGGAPGGSAQPRGRSGAGFGYGPELLDEMTTVKVVHLGKGVAR